MGNLSIHIGGRCLTGIFAPNRYIYSPKTNKHSHYALNIHGSVLFGAKQNGGSMTTTKLKL